jgi:hypothetical protein
MLHRLSLALALLCGLSATSVLAGPPTETPIAHCRSLIGQSVTIKGRTGHWVKPKGEGVYLLRDDNGDTIYVRITPESKSSEQPLTMGFTYYVLGTPEADPVTGELWLKEMRRWRAYPLVSPWALAALAAVVVLVVAGGIPAVIIMVRRHRPSLQPAWGFAEVVSGPEQGQRFDLRSDRIVVGRGQDRLTAIGINEDEQVSREHGLVLREGDALYYQDTNSKNKSWVDEQLVSPGERVPLKPGSLLRLGPVTVVRFGTAGPSITETMVVEAGVTETAGEDATGGAPEPPE